MLKTFLSVQKRHILISSEKAKRRKWTKSQFPNIARVNSKLIFHVDCTNVKIYLEILLEIIQIRTNLF